MVASGPHRTEKTIWLTLRYGVLLCGAVLAWAIVLFLREPHDRSLLGSLKADTLEKSGSISSWGDLVAMFTVLDANGIAVFGLLLLIALPIVRVALTVVLFAVERDWIYFIITSIVLLILLSSMLVSSS